jgi:hypothetical protein
VVVIAESDERTGIVFQADSDGSGLAEPTERALERTGTDCLQQAGGDVAKVQVCVQEARRQSSKLGAPRASL